MSEEVKDNSKDILAQINEQTKRAEGIYIGTIFKNPDLLLEYTIPLDNFSNRSPWKIYYAIAREMITKRKYETLDNLAVDTFVNDNMSDKMKSIYLKTGGYEPIEDMSYIVEESNIHETYRAVLKYHTITKLQGAGYNIIREWDNIKNLDHEQISHYVESRINDVFTDIGMETTEKVVDLTHGLREVIDESDKGLLKGLPYNSRIVNSVLSGMKRGEMAYFAAMSGVGKSYLATILGIFAIVERGEKVLIMTNEEGEAKFKREMITYWANNYVKRYDERFKDNKDLWIYKGDFRNGNFDKETKELMYASADYINEKIAEGLLNFIDLSTFSTDKAIRLIKQYKTKYNVNYFIIDTFKHDNTLGSSVGDTSWLDLQQASVRLFNTIKESNLNVFLLLTYQISKNKRAYLDQTSLGMAKNVVDVADTLVLIRDMFKSEREGGIKVVGHNKEDITLNPDNDYMILFFDKNRAGTTSRQVVLKIDFARNMINDVGFTSIAEDM